jgi:hypothetical protein
MSDNYTYLRDSSFLKKIDKARNKEQYVKVTILNFEEKPIQAIQGRVIGGNLNLNGSSTVRRTCNLTMIAEEFENDLTNVNNIFSINKKVKLETGFLNTFGSYKELDIIWFPLGKYVITSASISHSTSGITISLQLKDKMCLLNGECGGTLPASVTFHEYDTVDADGKYVTLHPTIYKIIQELVSHYGGEQLSKIIISDIDTKIKKVMKWVGSTPLYIMTDTVGGETTYTATTDVTKTASAQSYKTYEYGSDIGYIYTDFIYPDELIGDAGDSVCTILDEIKDTLGNYEYFYDIYGNFVFQEIKNYLNTSQSTVVLNNLTKDDYLIDISKGKTVYQFDDCSLFTSCSNSPQYNMIKNDFIVWGIRETSEGLTYPIRYHLAIDKKPSIGNQYKVFFYTDETDNLIKAKCPVQYPNKSQFPTTGVQETFYMDLSNDKIYAWDAINKEYEEITEGLKTITTSDWRTELYLQGSVAEPLGIDSNYYYTELSSEWPKLYDVENGAFYEEAVKYPSDLDFYLDFIDSSAAISELSIANIGRRTKVVNDDSINCMFEPEIPDLVLLNIDDEDIAENRQECINKGQNYMQIDGSLYNMVASGGNFNSAYNLVRELLYQYTSYNESISINSIPIFYLEPNTRIAVRDAQSGIYGDYMINSISIPFDVASTMTLSCTRALERI